MNILTNLYKSIHDNSSKNAFFINKEYFTYKDLAQEISNIRQAIKLNIGIDELNVGLITNDDLQTYASIIALWMEGKAYVPLNPDFPINRNNIVINQADILSILDSSDESRFINCKTIQTKNLIKSRIDLIPKEASRFAIAYILFTSGTTGVPKGVPITIDNLSGFIEAFWELNYSINYSDRCLQMFELTFDMSVMSYLLPILKGACVYTIPKNKIKYSYIFELMEDYELTFAAMVPSILHYLRPYFDEINCPKMKFCLFAGEALHEDIANEWSRCLPNATIVNAYGPTETTIICTNVTYEIDKTKSYNGILTLGKPMLYTDAIIVDEDKVEVKNGESGELCLSGKQLTTGYWKNKKKNKEVLFFKDIGGVKKTFYKTGDLCFKDKEDDIFYIGRIDFQAKIQGYRVELSEIEFHSKSFFNKINVVALAISNYSNNTEIGLVIESEELEMNLLLKFLKTKLPLYMIPSQIKFIKQFPLNVNGKIDRNILKELF